MRALNMNNFRVAFKAAFCVVFLAANIKYSSKLNLLNISVILSISSFVAQEKSSRNQIVKKSFCLNSRGTFIKTNTLHNSKCLENSSTFISFSLFMLSQFIFSIFFHLETFLIHQKLGTVPARLMKILTCGSPSRCEQSSWSNSTSTASTNSSDMACSRASFVSTR